MKYMLIQPLQYLTQSYNLKYKFSEEPGFKLTLLLSLKNVNLNVFFLETCVKVYRECTLFIL